MNRRLKNKKIVKSTQKYLINDICKFTPLFNINKNKKQDIFSASFFKINSGSYKNFNIYVQGMKDLSKYVNKYDPTYKIRLFIDYSIFNDTKIMNMLKKLNNVQLVLYHCENFVRDKIYHRGIFGTIVRYFPIFNFPKNDAGIVRIIDIDLKIMILSVKIKIKQI